MCEAWFDHRALVSHLFNTGSERFHSELFGYKEQMSFVLSCLSKLTVTGSMVDLWCDQSRQSDKRVCLFQITVIIHLHCQLLGMD